MSDSPAIHIGENSPEHVAYRLLTIVASIDGFALSGTGKR